MISITQIPIEDIELFISKNNYDIPDNNKDMYNLANNLLRTAKYYPDIIIDWIIAHNLIILGTKVPIHTKSEISLLNNKELDNLAKLLKLDRMNIDSILNILNFIGKLKKETTIYDIMDPEIIQEIALNLSYDDIINNCNTSEQFNYLICKNNHFWKLKTDKDYPGQKLDGNWRRTYEKSLPKVYTFGSGSEGKLGHGDNSNIYIPKVIESLKNVTSVSCGYNHTAVISNGKLYTFGEGHYGQLGHGNKNNLSTPELVKGLENVTSVSCGVVNTAVIAAGKLYTFGYNHDGRLGHGNKEDVYVPKIVESFKNVTSVSCGNNHTAVIANDKLYTFGNGNRGQLGHGDNNHIYIPKIIESLDNVSSVSCGSYYTAVVAKGKLYTFGDGDYGKLGHENDDDDNDYDNYDNNVYVPKVIESLNNVTSVSCGYDHTAAISDSKLYTFGSGIYGQLGHGKLEHDDNDDDDDDNNVYVPKIIESFKNVTSVSCGANHTAVISNGKLYTFGNDEEGQLGGDTENVYIPEIVKGLNNVVAVSCGNNYTAVIAS